MLESVLAWMDLEMTGLNPKEDVIVEIATLITNDDLEEIAAGPNLVINQPFQKLESMSKHVEQMHTSSGLLDEISKSTTSLSMAGEKTLEFLSKIKTEGGFCKSILTDMGPEFLNKKFFEYCESEGIIHYVCPSQAHWSNGGIERRNRTIRYSF